MEKTAELRPWIARISPEIVPPSLKDNTADVDRLIKAIKKTLDSEEVSVDFPLVKHLPGRLRSYDYRVDAVLFWDKKRWHLIDILPH